MTEKIQKVLARAGVASRRTIEKWIQEGRIKINDALAELGQRVELTDIIFVDGKEIILSSELVSDVLMYHKPLGEICTEHDPEGRPTVFSSLPQNTDQRWVMIGRLDINTSGLLLFTTNGELANRLMHPKYEIEREYVVRVHGIVTPEKIIALKQGVMLTDGLGHFDKVEHLRGSQRNTWYKVIIKEGRKREVRRLWESQDCLVNRLSRLRYGCITLPEELLPGQSRRLSGQQLVELGALVGLEIT